MADIILTAPMQGWACGLDVVPDPVFAGCLLGDGLAIDPTGDTLHAPCDAVVIALHDSHHAVTLRTAHGAEILMHIGLDTVALNGVGFTPKVAVGQSVRAGDPLIAFDLDALVRAAPAVVTPIIITNGDRFAITGRRDAGAVAVGDRFLTIVATGTVADETVEPATGEMLRHDLTVALAHGLHARPAARIGACARGFDATLHLVHGDRDAVATSAVGIMALGIRHGDTIAITGTGPDAQAAIDAVAALIASGMGEGSDTAAASLPPPAPAPTPAPAAIEGALTGVLAAPGLAIGVAGVLKVPDIVVPVDGRGTEVERPRLDAALAAVAQAIAARAATLPVEQRAILDAHRAFIEDPDLIGAARAQVAQGRDAGFAWRQAIRVQSDILRSIGDARLAERADDLLDLERQVLHHLAGITDTAARFAPGTILLADDLLPSQVIGLDIANVVGLCVERGGPTSHVAILAATMGLPALVAMGPVLDGIAAGTPLILDADAGMLHVDPPAAMRETTADRVAAAAARRSAALAAAGDECRTADGVRIEAFANLGSAADAALAVTNGAEGCGLLRTEFLFLDRDAAPDEDEQAATYQRIADALEGRPLIARLLDIGGDKPAPYLPIAAEENPALGLRGIRVGLAMPDVLDVQLRALLRVVPAGQLRIMVPMIASLDELRRVRAALDRAKAAMGITHGVALGIMVETPAAAVTADLLAAEADFLSVGTNDLTQYTLAMDRGNPAVAAGIDGLHPAVLRLIRQTCAGAAAYGKWTGVCGGLASDPLAIPILIGLGVTELSSAPALVPQVKALVRTLTLDATRAHADAVCALSSPADVRAAAIAFRQEHGA
ncbi:PTS galactitol transporter subunit IIC [Sphingomonas sp. Leaf17]|uniref:phosphoenolpyruvate--protein phosphotransferase n=1 Tax=Sphingomonas sp. Leaf17 TaxID=1735683 RepID=UPI0006F589E2|nr:phosphoenolpyruvate--protein phosphotransferase [Sphingomonas sp. Leaf17]KQM63376.1 PTS galactitol transporter subunit IIC [Sphingomonas sp. Leaf17]